MEKMIVFGSVLLLFVISLVDGQTWCYRCVSTQPGCGEFNFDWRWYWSYTCPRDGDKCVKVIERKGTKTLVTRECLSLLEGHRRDIPSDRFEGCRPASKDIKLGHYQFNEISELDTKRDYFEDTTYCFCDFDWFCNKSTRLSIKFPIFTLMVATAIARFFMM